MDSNYIINTILKSAGLDISTGGSAKAKTVNNVLYKIADVIYTALTAGNVPVLTGIDIDDGFSKIVLVQVDNTGTMSVKASSAFANVTNEVAVLANAPTLDEGMAFVGLIVISNASGSVFTGNTTALDAGGITTTYIDAPVIGA